MLPIYVKDNKIRVVASGSHETIIVYHDSIKQHLVPRLFGNELPQYKPTDLEEYNGLDIDWNSFNRQFIAAQLSKTMLYSSEIFNKLGKRIDEIYNRFPLKRNNDSIDSLTVCKVGVRVA